MSQSPPQGTKIKIDWLNGHQLIVLPHKNAGVMRYFIGLFLIFWLTGWFMGFTSTAEEIISGKAGAFLIFWFCGWTLGGAFALYFIYRLFRIPIPEQILLNKPYLSVDTGIPPYEMNFGTVMHKNYWSSMFPKRKKLQFTHNELKSLCLRETDSGNRLTIDQGAIRTEIATNTTEIEREWLFKYLQTNYS
jgi:hypothetical protein